MGPQAQLTTHNAEIAHLTLTIAKLRRMQLKKAQPASQCALLLILAWRPCGNIYQGRQLRCRTAFYFFFKCK